MAWRIGSKLFDAVLNLTAVGRLVVLADLWFALLTLYFPAALR